MVIAHRIIVDRSHRRKYVFLIRHLPFQENDNMYCSHYQIRRSSAQAQLPQIRQPGYACSMETQYPEHLCKDVHAAFNSCQALWNSNCQKYWGHHRLNQQFQGFTTRDFDTINGGYSDFRNSLSRFSKIGQQPAKMFNDTRDSAIELPDFQVLDKLEPHYFTGWVQKNSNFCHGPELLSHLNQPPFAGCSSSTKTNFQAQAGTGAWNMNPNGKSSG